MNSESRGVRGIVNSVVVSIGCTVLAMVVFVTLSGCQSDDPSKAVPKAKSIFNEVLTEFKDQTKKVQSEFEEGKNTLLSFQKAMKTAQDKDPEFAKVYSKWKRVEAEVKRIHEKFANLVKGADALYAEFENRANSITNDEQLKMKMLRRINESKEAYIIECKQSRDGLNKLDDANIKVQNTMKALEISYGLKVVEERVSQTFQEIDMMIESVMKDLEGLSRKSELLLTIRFE